MNSGASLARALTLPNRGDKLSGKLAKDEGRATPAQEQGFIDWIKIA
jgi:hypothetical protein